MNPTNVFLTEEKEENQNSINYKVKVLDFNVSKMIEESKQNKEQEDQDDMSPKKKDKFKMITKVGTPIYTAPEMHTFGGVYTESVDVWGVGIIMYLLLTGTLPFLEYSIPKLK